MAGECMDKILNSTIGGISGYSPQWFCCFFLAIRDHCRRDAPHTCHKPDTILEQIKTLLTDDFLVKWPSTKSLQAYNCSADHNELKTCHDFIQGLTSVVLIVHLLGLCSMAFTVFFCSCWLPRAAMYYLKRFHPHLLTLDLFRPNMKTRKAAKRTARKSSKSSPAPVLEPKPVVVVAVKEKSSEEKSLRGKTMRFGKQPDDDDRPTVVTCLDNPQNKVMQFQAFPVNKTAATLAGKTEHPSLELKSLITMDHGSLTSSSSPPPE